MTKALGRLKDWRVESRELGPGQEVLVLRPPAKVSPSTLFLIGSAASAQDRSEVAIQIRIDPSVIVSKTQQSRVLAEINAHHQRNWAGTFFVDPDHSLLGQWTFNLPGRPLNAAFVRDAVLRLEESWAELNRALHRAKLTP